MRRQHAEKRLRELGFEIDWSVTGPCEGYWSGSIDPIGNISIGGDCYGPVIHGDNAADWYRNAVTEAESLSGQLKPCTNSDCDMHKVA